MAIVTVAIVTVSGDSGYSDSGWCLAIVTVAIVTMGGDSGW